MTGDCRKTGVGGKVRGRSEGFVHDLSEEPSSGPDASRHAGQNRAKEAGACTNRSTSLATSWLRLRRAASCWARRGMTIAAACVPGTPTACLLSA